MNEARLRKVALITTNQVELGVRALSGAVRAAGYDTQMVFLPHPGDRYPEPVVDQVVDQVRDADLIGISTLAYSHRRTRQLAAAMRPLEIPIVLGGVHCTFQPENAIQDADIVCLGEGEESLVELLKNWGNHHEVAGFWFRTADGNVVCNPRRPLIQSLDSLPMPDWSADRVKRLEGDSLVQDSGRVSRARHHQTGIEGTFVYASDRGCGCACAFCYNHKMRELYHGQRALRFKSVDGVLADLHEILRQYQGIKFINFMNDDSFARPVRDIKNFASRYKAEIGLPFFMMGTEHTITEERLVPLVDAGLRVLNMGIQSGSDRVLRSVYQRPSSAKRILVAAGLINRYRDRLAVYYDLIINSPFDTEPDLLATVDLVRKLPTPFYLVTHNLVIGPGTHLWHTGREQGLWELEEGDRIYESDFHDFENFGSRKHVHRYLNSLLEWLAGHHDRDKIGRLPRYASQLDSSICTVLRPAMNGCFGLDSQETLDILTSHPILDATRMVVLEIESMAASIPPKIYWKTGQ